ncbi:hypothetical protein FRC08_012797 [Ceratobasidium sp. 394]|nr:hypothetical protein FRC08_012797 [Ceratobasidium sp. 394]
MSEQRLNSDIHDEDNRSHVFHGPGGGDRPPDPAPPGYQQQQQHHHDRHQNQNNGRGNHHHNRRGNYHNNRHRGNGQHYQHYQHHRNRHGGGLMSLAHTIALANLVSSCTATNTVRPYGPPALVAWRYGGYDAPDHGQHLALLANGAGMPIPNPPRGNVPRANQQAGLGLNVGAQLNELDRKMRELIDRGRTTMTRTNEAVAGICYLRDRVDLSNARLGGVVNQLMADVARLTLENNVSKIRCAHKRAGCYLSL